MATVAYIGAGRKARASGSSRAVGDVPFGQTLAEGVRLKLETLISLGECAPGTRLDEQELAQRFGVSRTPVREAFRLLAANNLVELRGRQGAVVRTIRAQDLVEMFQVMAELEGLCARLAARRIGAAGGAALRVTHQRLVEVAQTGDIDAFYDANLEFHDAVIAASHNGFLADQTRQLRNRVDVYRRRVTYVPNRLPDTITEHAAVIDAICAGDGEAAHRLMRDHVNLLGDVLLDFLAVFS